MQVAYEWEGQEPQSSIACAADGWRDPSSTTQSYVALVRNSVRRCTARNYHVRGNSAGQTRKQMLMVTAPLHWPPTSNLGRLCIIPVDLCRYHPPKSRGALEVERSDLWLRGARFFHGQPSEPHTSARASGSCSPPSATREPAQGLNVRKGAPLRGVATL